MYDPTAIIFSPDRANVSAEGLSLSMVIILALRKIISALVVVCPRSVVQEINVKLITATEIISIEPTDFLDKIFFMTNLLNK